MFTITTGLRFTNQPDRLKNRTNFNAAHKPTHKPPSMKTWRRKISFSSTSTKKIIVVVGATGNQGSSVAHTFLKLRNWHVRCLTRNPFLPASLALASLGAEVVQVDLSVASSLSRTFSNANAIFLNTDFWGTSTSPELQEKPESERGLIAFEKEVLHGKNAAHAAAAVPSLEQFVYSTLPAMRKVSNGKHGSSFHWEAKATVVDYILEEEPELAKKTSFIYLGGYTTNAMLTPRLDPASGKYSFVLPLRKDVKMPIIDPKESTGPFVRALIENEDAGTKLLAYDSHLAMEEVPVVWSRATGKEVAYVEVSADIMHYKFGISKEILEAPGFINEYGYMGGVDGSIEPFQLKKQVQTKSYETWLKEQEPKEV
ncbi:NAD(P)-binding protein [Acephala macrosclerotiorum]|nr:NAD(P)-binding protein [Acephala macrosclerotiorum]